MTHSTTTRRGRKVRLTDARIVTRLLGKLIKTNNARIYDTYTYANDRGIIQRLADNQVEIVVDEEEEQA